jgi:hypothetical protein
MLKILPRSYDRRTNPDALGIAFSKEMMCIALVSKVGVSDLWLYVNEGSDVLSHVPGYAALKSNITFIGGSFNFERTIGGLQSALNVPVGPDDTDDSKRLLAWDWTRRNGSTFHGRVYSASGSNALAALIVYYFEQAYRASDAGTLRSPDDLTVVYAVLNALVALGVGDEEAAYNARTVREAELQEAILNSGPADSDWLWVSYEGKRQRFAPAIAKALISLGAATLIGW